MEDRIIAEEVVYEDEDVIEEDYQKLYEEQLAKNKEYLKIFKEDLEASGLKPETIRRHMDNANFYINTFLLREEPNPIDAGAYMIDSFLGDFFIRKCLWSTPATIKSTAASIKKFYKSMMRHGILADGDYEFLLYSIKLGMEEWQELCETYNDIDAPNPFFPFFWAIKTQIL